ENESTNVAIADAVAAQPVHAVIQMNSRNSLTGTADLGPVRPEILDLTQPAANHQFAFDNQQFFLLDYWRVLVKRRWLIAGSLAFMLAAAVVVSLKTTPMYRAA